MEKALSIYLDLIRFLAAIGVLFSHLYIKPFTDSLLWWRLGGYGDACVTVFFVLSGYVIAHVTSTREQSIKAFFVSRVSRLYSVTLFGLLLTCLFDMAGSAIDPIFYANEKVISKPVSVEGYLASLFFVNEFQVFGFGGISPGSNGPFWSLSFEAAYYAAAAFLLFLPWRLALPASMVLLWMAGRTIVALLPVWFLGFGLYHLRGRLELTKWVAWSAFAASAVFLLLLQNVMNFIPSDNFGVNFPWGRKPFNRALLADYIVALVFAVHLLSAQEVLGSALRVSGWLEQPVRWLGELTFPLYCLHYPAMCFLCAISPWAADTWLNLAFVTAGIFSLVAVATPLCERFKAAIRNQLTALVLPRTAAG